MRLNLKLALVFVALLAAKPAANADVTVGIDPNAAWEGFMSVTQLDGTPEFNTAWGFNDLWSPLATSPFQNGELEITGTPIGTDDAFWYGATAGGPNRVGDKLMNAAGFVTTTDTFGGMNVTFEGSLLTNTFTEHTGFMFIRDFAPDFSSFTETTQAFTPGAFSITHATDGTAGRHVQYGFAVTGANVWPDDAANFGSVRLQAIPEPGSIAVLSLGLLGFTFRRRR